MGSEPQQATIFQARTISAGSSGGSSSLPAIAALESEFATSLQQTLARIPREKHSALIAVRLWRDFLIEPADHSDRSAAIGGYLRSMGYLQPRDSLANAARRAGVLSVDTFRAVVGRVLTGSDPIAEINAGSFAPGGLSPAQGQLLGRFLRHQCSLDALDLRSLSTAFPFPISAHNFFGRFLAGGAEDPAQAARHVQLAMPFFIRVRSLLERLSDTAGSIVGIEWIGNRARDSGSRNPGKLAAWEAKTLEFVHACIASADDFTGGAQPRIQPGMVVIPVPSLPAFDLATVDHSEFPQLTRELFDWALFGEDNGILLRRKQLAPSEEATIRAREREKQRLEQDLRQLSRTEPAKGSSRRSVRAWEAQCARLEKQLSSVTEHLSDMYTKRAGVQSILKQLESDHGGRISLAEFRRRVGQAVADRRNIVFSLFHEQDTGDASFLGFFDRAMQTRYSKTSRGLEVLRAASFLMPWEYVQVIEHNAAHHSEERHADRSTAFPLFERELTPSLERLVARVLPRRRDPRIEQFADLLVMAVDTPGTRHGRELLSLVRQQVGRQPTPAHLLEYVFEHAIEVKVDALWKVLRSLHSFGIAELTPRALELYRERFRLPPRLLRDFSRFATFRPQRIGDIPGIFENLTTFERFCTMELEGIGLHPEVGELERLLAEQGIVVVVDSTNYHPELAAKVGDEKVKADQEKLVGAPGRYTRPSERLMLSFALRMMEGNGDERLKNSSIVLLRKPTKEDKAIERFYKMVFGLDVSVTPDLSAVNNALSDLTLFDARAILVLDAEAVKQTEHFRHFLDLLAEYRIRAIVRSREPFPGLPQLLVRPFADHEVPERLAHERPALESRLGVSVPQAVLDFVSRRVQVHRRVDEDPVAVACRVLEGAAQSARQHRSESLSAADAIAALSPVFNLPNQQQVQHLVACVEGVAQRLPMEVLGQVEPIQRVVRLVQGHVMGLRDPTRPLTILIPGPTGVGKTELMMRLAQALNFPFFLIEGAQFSEPHTISRLTGSPSGYVGPDKGPLYLFLEENRYGVVFCDEIEKMHPAVYTALMQLLDKGSLTAGDGSMVFRPGMIIGAASNAGASRLHRGMSRSELREVLSEAFVDGAGRPRPELVARFEPIPMLAIEEQDFRSVIRANLHGLGDRAGVVTAGIELESIDDAAANLLYDEAALQCRYAEKGLGTSIGYHRIDRISGYYYDMRHVSRALDVLARESLQRLVMERLREMAVNPRGPVCKVKLLGVMDERVIRFERQAG